MQNLKLIIGVSVIVVIIILVSVFFMPSEPALAELATAVASSQEDLQATADSLGISVPQLLQQLQVQGGGEVSAAAMQGGNFNFAPASAASDTNVAAIASGGNFPPASAASDVNVAAIAPGGNFASAGTALQSTSPPTYGLAHLAQLVQQQKAAPMKQAAMPVLPQTQLLPEKAKTDTSYGISLAHAMGISDNAHALLNSGQTAGLALLKHACAATTPSNLATMAPSAVVRLSDSNPPLMIMNNICASAMASGLFSEL